MKVSFKKLRLVGGDGSAPRVWLDAFCKAVIIENGGDEWPVGMTSALITLGFSRTDQIHLPNVFVRTEAKKISFQDVARVFADEIHNSLGYIPFKGEALELLRKGIPDFNTRYSVKVPA